MQRKQAKIFLSSQSIELQNEIMFNELIKWIRSFRAAWLNILSFSQGKKHRINSLCANDKVLKSSTV